MASHAFAIRLTKTCSILFWEPLKRYGRLSILSFILIRFFFILLLAMNNASEIISCKSIISSSLELLLEKFRRWLTSFLIEPVPLYIGSDRHDFCFGDSEDKPFALFNSSRAISFAIEMMESGLLMSWTIPVASSPMATSLPA